MKPTSPPYALFYPFHLCHEATLAKLLLRFAAVHFRNFMALQLTPMIGMTAYADRMGDSFPDLLTAGRLVQGYDVSGPLPDEVVTAIDMDLKDQTWRAIFDRALRADRRFLRGLFGTQHPPDLSADRLETVPFQVKRVKHLCSTLHADEMELHYGMALVKTSASLIYTYRLALTYGLQTATDSTAHFELFQRTCRREHITVGNHLVVRKGY
ncbi:MAG TPA: hypothetical protein VKP13_05855 [Nitrospira sp.]|nr:hypothetical protein [Nitrospira sp.]